MITLVSLIALVLLLAAHEYLAGRTSRRSRGTWVRRLLVLGAMAAAITFGHLGDIPARIRTLITMSSAPAAPFTASGDPFLRNAVAGGQPARPFPVAGSPEDVGSWRSSVSAWLRAAGSFDTAAPPAPTFQVLATEVQSGVRRTLVTFSSWDGTAVPAYVHEPEDDLTRAAVLVIPGHGAGIRATAGIVRDYQHAAAIELARRGYVTLTPELRGFGLLAVGDRPVHRAVAFAALEAGTFYKAVIARDLRLALSLLQRWKHVDPTRVAVVGASLGGELAVFLAAVDDRPRVIVSHSYGGAVGPETVGELEPDDSNDTPHGCHTIPGVNAVLLQEDWFRLVAPRALQVVRGDRNRGADAATFGEAVAPAFAIAGAAGRFEYAHEAGGHELFVERAADFLARWL